MSKSNIKKYLGDGILIVFSVLFALFINNLAQKNGIKNKKEIALNSIKKELQRNKEIVAVWNSHHAALSSRLDSLVKGKNDSLIKELRQQEQLDLSLLTGNKPLVQELISKTAWETAKSTGIVAEFDFETSQMLTKVYILQDEVAERSLRSVIDLYFDRKSYNMNDLLETVNQFNLRLMNLVGQEYSLKYFYDEALKQLE